MTDTRVFSEEVLRDIPESKKINIISPKEGAIFKSDKDEQTRLITIKGSLDIREVGKGRKILVVIRTDRNYPQALGLAKEKWEFADCRLGGVDHEVFAILMDFEDRPLFRSKSVNVRLLRK